MMDLPVVYQDEDVIAVDKPAGLLSVPGRGAEKRDSVEWRIKQEYCGAAAVHRLDMSTSGIMLIAKHKDAERYYKTAFEQRRVKKGYVAICHGLIAEDEGEMNAPLIGDWVNRPKQKVCYETGKAALTRFCVLSRQCDQTRVALFPHTGRSHQLRVHLADKGHPIVGDNLYGDAADCLLPRLLLHAEWLLFTRRDGVPIKLSTKIPF